MGRQAFAEGLDGAPGFTATQTLGAIGFGVLALLASGLSPLLFGLLDAAGRLTAAEIGWAAALETLVLGVVTAGCGARLAPRRLRTIAVLAALALALADLVSGGAAHGAFVAVRTAAGAAEGVLLWLAISLIARTATPERWAGALALGQPLSQFPAGVLLSAFVLPRAGAGGAFVALGVLTAACGAAALALPRALAPLPQAQAQGGPLPALGLASLVGSALFLSVLAGVAVFLGPLATRHGVDAAGLSTAVAAFYAAQIAGAGAATTLGGRAPPLALMAAALAFMGGGLVALRLAGDAAAFAGGAAAFGLGAFLGMPALVGLAVEADPSRRSALQSGAAQLLGSALGPLAAAAAATAGGVDAVLGLGAGLGAATLLLFAAVDRASRRGRAQ